MSPIPTIRCQLHTCHSHLNIYLVGISILTHLKAEVYIYLRKSTHPQPVSLLVFCTFASKKVMNDHGFPSFPYPSQIQTISESFCSAFNTKLRFHLHSHPLVVDNSPFSTQPMWSVYKIFTLSHFFTYYVPIISHLNKRWTSDEASNTLHSLPLT